MITEHRRRWNTRYRTPDPQKTNQPRELLAEHAELLPTQGMVLELAVGVGQNVPLLHSHGLNVVGVDFSIVAARHAKGTSPRMMALVADLTQFQFPSDYFDVALNFYYLQRDFWGEFERILKPGGLLFYETLTQNMLAVREEISPEYLLQPGELKAAFSDWEILFYWEGWRNYANGKRKAVASLIGRRPPN